MQSKHLPLMIAEISILLIIFHTSFEDENILDRKYDVCKCGHKTPKLYRKSFYGIEGNAFEYESYSISCCAKEFIGGDKRKKDFNITWSFIGKYSMYSTLQPLSHCFGQIASSDRIDPNESGNHTCTIKTEDGKMVQKFVKVRINKGSIIGSDPIGYNNSGTTTYATQNENVTLKCSFFFRKRGAFLKIFWRKYWYDRGTYHERIAVTLPRTKEKINDKRSYYLTSTLSLRNISDIHFGNYSCNAVTLSKVISQNISLINDVHPDVKLERVWRSSLIFSLIALFCLLIGALILFRCRYVVALKWNSFKSKFEDGEMNLFTHDVFLIYGSSASAWVFEVLLKRLEDEWNYDCFIPERDILGGENLDSICREISLSRRTVVIVTECLLRSHWNSHVTVQAIHSSITSTSHLIAITHSETAQDLFDENLLLLDVIKLMKKIPLPSTLSSRPLKINQSGMNESSEEKPEGTSMEHDEKSSTGKTNSPSDVLLPLVINEVGPKEKSSIYSTFSVPSSENFINHSSTLPLPTSSSSSSALRSPFRSTIDLCFAQLNEDQRRRWFNNDKNLMKPQFVKEYLIDDDDKISADNENNKYSITENRRKKEMVLGRQLEMMNDNAISSSSKHNSNLCSRSKNNSWTKLFFRLESSVSEKNVHVSKNSLQTSSIYSERRSSVEQRKKRKLPLQHFTVTLPINKKEKSEEESCRIGLKWIFRNIILENSEELFWQRLRLHIHHPLSKRNNRKETKKSSEKVQRCV